MIARRVLIAAALASLAEPALAAPLKPPVVTLLGDSITAGLGLPAAAALPAQLQLALAAIGSRVVVRGAGVSGDTTAGGLARLDFSVQPDTTLCVVELGANDFLQSVSPKDTQANLIAIIKRLKALGVPVVLAGSDAPRAGSGAYGREFDAAFRAAAKAGGAILAPNLLTGVLDRPGFRQADGLHPNAQGVVVMARRLAPFVVRASRLSRQSR